MAEIVNASHKDIQFYKKKEIVSIFLQYLSSEYNRDSEESPLFASLASSSRFALRMIERSLEGNSVIVGSGLVDNSL